MNRMIPPSPVEQFYQDTEALINKSVVKFVAELEIINDCVKNAKSKKLPADGKEIIAAVMISKPIANNPQIRPGTYYIHLAISDPQHVDFPKRVVRISNNANVGFFFELLDAMPAHLAHSVRNLYIHGYKKEPTEPDYLAEVLEDWIVYGKTPVCDTFPKEK